METLIKKYRELSNKINAINYAFYLISWDSETEAPVGCFDERSKQMGVLSSMMLDIKMSDEYFNVVAQLHKSNLDGDLKIEIEKVYKDLSKERKLPQDLLVEFNILMAKSANIWANAKQNNDYSLFKPILAQILDFLQKYVKLLGTEKLNGYNLLLDEYEEGFNMEKYDEFFLLLRKEIVPLLKQIKEQKEPYDYEFSKKIYSITKQKEYANYLLKVMNFDLNRGLMKESEHPFTSGYGTSDVRITTHYYPDLLISSIFSVIHEGGHATYELQCDPKYDNTALSGGTSMAFHESQSRFYENIIGRKYSFWETHYPKLQEIFNDELKDVTLDEFYHYVNLVTPSLIRTEADELTYPLHIMVRYELEKLMINNQISLDELPNKWNELYKEYLGVDVPSDKEGVLQDVHWSGGSLGYFPTYALGSAYAAQIYHQMEKEINVDEIIKSGNLLEINNWLKEKVHKYAGSKKPEELLLMITGEKFNPKYYVDYLKNKYTKIYNLK